MAKRRKPDCLTLSGTADNPEYVECHFPYHPDIYSWVKTVPGRRFDGREKFWKVPITSAAILLAGAEKIAGQGIEVVWADGLKEAVEKARDAQAAEREAAGLPAVNPLNPNTLTIRRAGDNPETVELEFPYNYSLLTWIKSVPNRKFDPVKEIWSAPITSAREIVLGTEQLAEQGIEVAWAEGLRESLEAANAAQEKAREEAISASRAASIDGAVAAEIPSPPGREYLPFQTAGIAYAMSRENTLFGDEMGLGKTIQAIGVVNTDVEARRVTVFCPASLKVNWNREINAWSVRPAVVYVASGTPKVGSWEEIFQNVPAGGGSDSVERVEYLIVNYDIAERWGPMLHAAGLDVLIMDESHYLKNPKAKRTQQVLGKWDRDPAKQIAPIPARRRLALTGTPIPNRPIEAWPVVHALDPKTFRSFKEYATRYCDAVYGSYGLEIRGASNLDELQDKLRASVMVRRLKADVLKELPPKRRQVLSLPAPSAVLKREREALDDLRKQAEEQFQLRVKMELAKAAANDDEYEKAANALRESVGIEFTTISRVRHETSVAKVPYVIEFLQNCVEQGEKVICFAHHLDVIEQIAEAFGEAAVVITGETPVPKRQGLVDRFQQDAACRVFVGNIKAAGVGLTLTASSHVVFAELDLVPGNLDQAEDRAHRIGQLNSVLVQHLIFDGSIDVSLANMVMEKQKVITAALDGEHAPLEAQEVEVGPIQLTEQVSEFRPYAALIGRRDDEEASTRSASRDRIGKLASVLTDSEIAVAHEGVRRLAEVCDGASKIDGHGFNKLDASIGRHLALEPDLTPRQAALCMMMLRKYHRQLPEEVMNVITAALKRPLPKSTAETELEVAEDDEHKPERGVAL